MNLFVPLLKTNTTIQTGVRVAGVRLLPAAGDGVRGGDVARDALADGVPLEVDGALCVGSTGAGEARVGGGVLASILAQPVMVSGCGE